MKPFSRTEVEKNLIAITQQLLIESGEPSQREIKLDVSLNRHLGIDSLARAELFRRIEKKFAVNLPDHLLAEADNLQDIANYLSQDIMESAAPAKKEVKELYETTSVDPSKTKTLIDILLLYGKEAPNKAHIYFQHEDGHEEVITYGKLLDASLRVAAALRDKGLKENETVAIMQPTSPHFFYAFFGTLLAGGIPVPIYPPFRAHMLDAYAKTEAHILRNAEVRMLLTFDRAEILSHLLQGLVPSLKGVTTVDVLLNAKPLNNYFVPTAEHFAFIQYTSGSTSDPKGVLLAHHNLLANIRAYGKAIAVKPDDVAISWLPLYHDMGLIGMWLGSLYFGIPLVLLTPFAFLNHPEKWLWAIHRYRGTLSGAPNFAYELCVRKIEPHMIEGLDLTSWRVAANGAEKVYARTLEQFIKKFEPFGFKREVLMPVYGLAESTVCLAVPPLHRPFRLDHVDRKQFEEFSKAITTDNVNGLDFVGCGLPIEGHEVRIVDEDNRQLPERHVGRLQFRGPSSMQGYYHNPRATESVLHQGWIDSGDLAYLVDGELFITGRRKDLIIKAGRNLYPAEIEEVVGEIPGIRQGCVAAFGVTDHERGTEQLIVVAETKEKNKLKRDELKQTVQEAIAALLDITPDHIILLKPRTVPKTSSGKLQRAACKKMYMKGKLGKWKVPAWLQVVKLSAQSILHQVWRGLDAIGRFFYTLYISLMTCISLLPVWLIVKFAKPKTKAITVKRWAQFLVKVSFCPIKYAGLSHLLDAKPMIYTANHASYLDAILTLAIVPANTKFVGKKELFSAPIIRTFMHNLGYLAIDRVDLPKGLEDTKHIESALKNGDSILIFPEGTFSYASGLRPFRLGAFKIAAEAAVPICPIALKGTRNILRGDEKLLRPARVSITVSKPIVSKASDWQDVIELRNKTRSVIAKHCGEASLDYIAAQTVAPRPTKQT